LSAPLWLRRLRALLRRPRRIEGFVDGCVAGEIRGWALAPAEPGRRVHVVALCDGQVVAEALADLARADLLQDGRGDGRHGFRLKLPPALLDGAPRMIRVEGVASGPGERLLRGDIEVRPPEPPPPEPARAASEPAESRARVLAEGRAGLVIWGDGDDAATRTEASWARQDWPDRDLLRLSADEADEARARSFFRGAHTVAFARAGDELDPAAARLLVQARPLADVVAWRGRPEARALGVLLGESLDGAFAARGHALGAWPGRWTDALRAPGLRTLELWLASRAELRWAHLAGPISTPGAAAEHSTIRRQDAEGLQGLAWREPAQGRPARLVPSGMAGRITLAAWPAGGPEAQASLESLAARAPAETEIELLAAPGDIDPLQARLGGRAGLSIRAADAPVRGGAGAWLRALGEAASGEVVILVRAGVLMGDAPHGLEELAAWCLHPLAAAATVALDAAEERVAGLGLAFGPQGWRAGAAPAGDRKARPVLAAPAAFLAVSRARLAAVGGIDDARFPDRAADLDLGLRLRRAGWSSLALGDLAAAWSGRAATAQGADLAPFDPAELAAAAAAFPAGESA
jgi:hypothetical protein